MPLQQILPTWVALNNANLQSSTGLVDFRTGQTFPAGGLNAGDYFDITNQEALQLSFLANGLLFGGRYRYVLVDSGATAANVQTGTIGYLRNGTVVTSAVIVTAGSGQTPGTYLVPSNPGSGGGSGAILQVVVGAAGTVTANPVVLNQGFGYTQVPTFTLVSGGTPATFQAMLTTTPNIVTSYDVATAAGGASTTRPVVFLNAPTPGNFTFVQELGAATVLANATIGGGNTQGGWVDSTTGGTVTTRAATASPIGATVGRAADVPIASQLFKIYLTNTLIQD